MVTLIIMYALLAGTFSLGKVILQYTSPLFLVGVRMSCAGLILLVYHIVRYRTWFAIGPEHRSAFIKAALCTVYVPYILRYWGLVYVPASRACLLYNFSPFISYGLSWFLLHEQITWQKVLGLCIGFCGLIPLLLKPAAACSMLSGYNVGYIPEIALLISVTSMSYGWLIIHKLINQHNYPASYVNGICMTVGGVLALASSWLSEAPEARVTDILPFLKLLCIIVFISNIICHNLYGNLLKRYTPTMLTFAGFMSPLFTGLYGWLFMQETLSWDFFAASAFVALGLGIFYHAELTSTYTYAKAAS